MTLPEPWLRGPVAGIVPQLQPVAHALIMAIEDTRAAASVLTADELWARPSGAASAGFHLVHLAGSTDRLFTYARGEALSEAQRAALAVESSLDRDPPSLEAMLSAWHDTVDRALAQLKSTPADTLTEARQVGRAKLPSTVLGLLFHAAEHASRHTGQLVTTARIVKGQKVEAQG
jgi:uncharacterized damage-inducible protein DinB